MGIVVIGAAFMDIKGFPYDVYIPDGRNAGRDATNCTKHPGKGLAKHCQTSKIRGFSKALPSCPKQ